MMKEEPMRRLIASGVLMMIFYAAVLVISAAIAAPSSMDGFSSFFSPEHVGELYNPITADWQKYGEPFTYLTSDVFWKIYLGIICLVPTVFLLHYVAVGPKVFSHAGPQIKFFSRFTIIIHWLGAAAFVVCAVSGLLMVFGSFLGGGGFIRFARYAHILGAIVFVIPGIFMFLIWVKDMFPTLYDIKWIFILGGYLSKEKQPVPAGKYNAGQKAWFWLSTLGGLAMVGTGYIIWEMAMNLDAVRISVIIHNVFGIALVAFLLTHMYMSLFAIKGAIQSMITGYKSKDEVDHLHSKYKYE
jgi:formate dehydrogenase subunit gamma